MPILTGIELASRNRALRCDLPVVIVSGHSGALTQEGLATAGVREVVHKPFTKEELAEAVRRNLARDLPILRN
jgi:FixJ family two-component response regulator